MFCEQCGSVMHVASTSRGIQTFACKAGCDCYTFIFTDKNSHTPRKEGGTSNYATESVYVSQFHLQPHA